MAMVACTFMNRELLEPVIEEAHRRDFGVVAMKSARALNAPKEQETKNEVLPERAAMLNQRVPGNLSPHLKAYRYVLNNPHISAVISGMCDEKMVRKNLPLTRS
jgi:predicted aldo/keto reductase-like oxidoreductase